MRFKGAVEKSLKLWVQYIAAIKNGRMNKSKYWNRVCELKERKHINTSNQALPIRVFYFTLAALDWTYPKYLLGLKMENAEDLMDCKKKWLKGCASNTLIWENNSEASNLIQLYI